MVQSASTLWKALQLVGFAVICHAAYLVTEDRSVESATSQRLYIVVGLITCLIGFVFNAGPFHSCLAVDAFSDLSFNATQRRADFKLSCHRGQVINDALRKVAK